MAPFESEANCLSELDNEGYKYERVGGYDGDKCAIKNAVKITTTPTTVLNKPVVLSCSFARSFGDWTADINAKNITHIGGYNCRKIAGSFLMSQHSYGNAIDVVSVNDRDLKENYRELVSVACRYFTNVLGPDDDAAHSNHLHLDNGPGIGCGLRKLLRALMQ